jgi:fructose-1,6-bisphosphatase/inositol monophosphatase family enzyme
VVTEVDLASEALILERLAPSIEAHRLGLLTEERADDASRFESACFWCIDPLDGTLPFIENSPGYAVSIALLSRSGEPLIGVVHDPAAGITYHAVRQGGAFHGHPAGTTPPGSGEDHLTWCMDRSMRSLPNFPDVSDAVGRLAAEAGLAGVVQVGHAGAALNGCWVAARAPAIYFKLPKPAAGGGSVWDFAASACIVTECGGSATNVRGAPLDLNPAGSTFMNREGVLFASTPDLADALRRQLTAGHCV